MNYHFWIIGCQMNVADSERIARALNDHGHRQVGTAEDADMVLLTSCTVRQGAEDRLWGELGRLGKLKKARPDLVVGVTGCVTDGNVEGFLKKAPVVDLYVNPRRPEALIEYLAERGLMDAPDWGDLQPEKLGLGSTIAVERVSQAVSRYVPVIYGCNYNCTYCIVPYTRGVQASRKPEEILEESRWLLAEGAKELVLLGQTVDAYGDDLDPPVKLSELLYRLHDLPGLERIRFLTSHPNHMTPDLIDAVADLPKVCEHVNLPFQAGDDAILKRMARRYKAAHYRDLIDRIKERVPGVGLSTDVI
ncbi:MAG: MiaB/RimO family radical SAM methylthiotransferase, partial [Chloroflexota bacterium]